MGLVLAGGGAKGAYQVGVIEYLASAGVDIRAIAGTSIGALNGAVLASAASLPEGAELLTAVWERVGDLTGPNPVDGPPAFDRELTGSEFDERVEQVRRFGSHVLAPGFMEELVQTSINPNRLRSGIPIWVSAFPSALLDAAPTPVGLFIDVIRAKLGEPARWIHLNSLPTDEMYEAVLASAALPFVLPPRHIGSERFLDGGFVDNAPAGALAAYADCDHVIVVHLQQGLLWDTERHPELSVIEIRPTQPLASRGMLGHMIGLLDFSPDRLAALKQQGLEDAAKILGPPLAMIDSATQLHNTRLDMINAVEDLDPPST